MKEWLNEKQGFLSVAIKNFFSVGALFPSSRWAVKAVVDLIPETAKTIVEYGPGTGVVTKKVLEKLPNATKLIGIEVNKDFVDQLHEIQDKRLEVIHGDVVAMSKRLREYAPEGVDVILSNIPFTFIAPENREQVLIQTHAALKPGGCFIVYQYSPMMKEKLKKVFSRVETHFEIRNIPPNFNMVAFK